MNTQTKTPKRIIAARYFDELRKGDTVPRDEKTGDTLSFAVSKNYVIVNADTKEKILARCTQDCPCNLRYISTLPK
jgi:hypothetical protein